MTALGGELLVFQLEACHAEAFRDRSPVLVTALRRESSRWTPFFFTFPIAALAKSFEVFDPLGVLAF